MMLKLKADKSASSASSDRKRKYKLSTKELALMELEKKRKMEEKLIEKKKLAKSAGVPENFFDSAKTKAFLNLGKAPKKSILKNSSKPITTTTPSAPAPPAANAKARGTEWTSSAPVLTEAGPAKKEKSPKKEMSPSAKTLLRTPSGGAIDHLQQEEEVPKDFFDKAVTDSEKDKDLPEGFFDDPVMDAKARGIEYKVEFYI